MTLLILLVLRYIQWPIGVVKLVCSLDIVPAGL